MTGEIISHYRVVERVGAGGMGVVYRGHDLKLNRPVALKFLAPHLPLEETDRQRFLREAQAAAALDHPNICTVHAIDEADGETFIVMSFLEGRPLSTRIKDGPLEVTEALSIAIQMAEGLEAAHRKGVVHRDIKPANVMLLAETPGLVKLMDFGLAQLAGASDLTRRGAALGTVAYMSPEQGEGLETDHRTDIWSVGVVLYEMIAAQRPFRGEFDPAVVYSILHEAPPALAGLRPDVPAELEVVIHKCLEKQREERYQHAGELAADLRAVRAALEPSGSVKSGFQPVAASPKSWGRVAAALAAVALVLSGFLVVFSREGQEPPAPNYALRQVTRDTGYTGQPAFSADGRLLAYASDRSGEGNLDIWVQQLDGGDPFRITRDEADDETPSFSPDTGRVVFRSGRAGGGIYVVPTLGGTERRIAGDGSYPRFSPDGESISYAKAEFSGTNQIFWRAYVAPAAGGEARRVETSFAMFLPTVWSPDGQRLLGLASVAPGEQGRLSDSLGWGLAPVRGGEAVALNKTFEATRIESLSGPGAWLADGGWIIFDDDVGGVPNLWRTRISDGRQPVLEQPQRLTAGTGELAPSASRDGRIAFVSASFDQGVWQLSLGSSPDERRGAPTRITSGLSADSYPSVSRDGRKLVFTSDRAGNNDIWLRDLETGRETPLTFHPAPEDRGVISPDGTSVAFARDERGQSSVYLMNIARGEERLLLEHIGRHTSWTPDGNGILYYTASPIRWKLVDVESGQSRDLGVVHPRFPVHSLQFSPDQAWVSFKLQGDTGSHLFLARLLEGAAPDEADWISLGESGGPNAGHNWWSPDGRMLYYLSDRDGFLCIAAQALDAATKAPRGLPIIVQHFHGRLRTPPGAPFGFGLTGTRLYFPLRETKANIWLAEPRTLP